MFRRTLALLRAHLGVWRSIGVPITAFVVHALVAGVLCALIGEHVGPFTYALFAFALAAALVAVPLVGELGFLLRGDESSDWLDALPARALERRLAKALGVGLAIGGLALASLIPAALLAPLDGVAERALFVACGVAAVLSGAAVLLALQGLLARVPALVGLLEALIVAVVMLGVLVSLPLWVRLGDLAGFEAAGAWRRFPSAWFAAPFGVSVGDSAGVASGASGASNVLWHELWRPAAAFVLAALALLLLPRPKVSAVSGRTPLDLLLSPAVELARRWWIRRDERAGFDLVAIAFPREREVALRTYPLLGIPLAFLWVAFGMEEGREKQSLVALILFTPGIYLPVVLSHLPASASHAARWILDGAPLAASAIHEGARRAIAVRYVLPLHVVLALIAWQQVSGEFAARLALPAAAVSLLALRFLYAPSVDGLPLTKPTEEAVRVDALGGPLMVAGVGLALLAVAAERVIATPLVGVAIALVLFAVDAALARVTRTVSDTVRVTCAARSKRSRTASQAGSSGGSSTTMRAARISSAARNAA